MLRKTKIKWGKNGQNVNLSKNRQNAKWKNIDSSRTANQDKSRNT